MILNISRGWLLLAAVAMLLMMFSASREVQSANEQVAQPEQVGSVAARQRFQLPKIFDFELYKRLFKRAYHGLEETVRRKYMLARAFRAWVTSVKYKFRRSSFYLAINQFSDKSPEELEQMRNHQLGGRFKGKNSEHTDRIEEANQTGQLIPEVDPNNIEKSLRELTKVDSSNQNNEVLKELQDELSGGQQATVGQRKKRQVDQMEPRQLDSDKLISTGTGASLDPETAEKVVYHPDSNNAAYKAPEVKNSGLRDDYEQVTFFHHGLKGDHSKNLQDWFKYYFRDLVKVVKSDEHEHSEEWPSREDGRHLPDEVFFDHRESKCMFLPRAQYACGSCYAFTAITIAEWLYCKQTGQLTPFSEQYMIDCGRAAWLNRGCGGGSEFDAADFIHSYGLELAINYPYLATVDTCPYDRPNVDIRSMGYIRMPLNVGSIVPLDKFEKYIHVAPMFISISTQNGFTEYGGGVHDGVGCGEEPDHAVVLIGHGREDGQEYWLIRNSFDVSWGETGHYKLAKSSGCIPEGYGVLYATQDAQQLTLKAFKNRRHEKSVIESHTPGLKYQEV